MLSEKEKNLADTIVERILTLSSFIEECKCALLQNPQPKLSLLFERGFLAKVVSGYDALISTLEVQNSQFEMICIDLLKIDPYVMTRIVDIFSSIESVDKDFLEMYTEYAEYQAKFQSTEIALQKIRDEYGVEPEGVDDSYEYDEMLYNVDRSVVN